MLHKYNEFMVSKKALRSALFVVAVVVLVAISVVSKLIVHKNRDGIAACAVSI